MGKILWKRIFITVIIALLIVEQIFNIPTYAKADTGYDKTAPILNGLTIENANNVNTKDGLNVTLDLKEDGVGVTSIFLHFKNDISGESYTLNYFAGEDNKPLYSGKTKIKLTFGNGFVEETYSLYSVQLGDGNGNFNSYYADENKELWNRITNKITITKSSNKDRTAPKLNSFIIDSANDLDLSIENPKIKVELVEDGVGVSWISAKVVNEKGEPFYIRWDADGSTPSNELLRTGKHIINMDISTTLKKGVYQLKSVLIGDQELNTTTYTALSPEWKKFTHQLKVTRSKFSDTEASTIDAFDLGDITIKTPDCLNVPISITTDKYGIQNVNISARNEEGDENIFFWYADKPIFSGKYVLKFPVDPFWGEGNYQITSIEIESPTGERTAVIGEQLQNVSGFKNPTITVKSAFDINYYGSTANISNAVTEINKMKEGQTAVLDYRYNNKADSSIFQALAGKNKTVVFENRDVQWVFNGKDIVLSKCKTIDLNVSISKRKGSELGFPDDDYILYMKYASNGVLPGAVDMRISNAFLKEKYKVTSDLILTYYSTDSEVLDSDVECAKDGYAEYTIDHNSVYILSDKLPRLKSPTSFKAAVVDLSYVKLSWDKVAGANGYYIYRSTSKKGTYKKVATISNGKTIFYKDKAVTFGKTYYYKIQARSSDKKVKTTIGNVISCSVVVSGITGVRVSSKTASSVKISWKKQSKVSGYEIYQYKNAKWVKVKTNQNENTLSNTISKLSSGKTYKFKVRAYKVIKGKRYYGSFSSVLSVTTNKKSKK